MSGVSGGARRSGEVLPRPPLARHRGHGPSIGVHDTILSVDRVSGLCDTCASAWVRLNGGGGAVTELPLNRRTDRPDRRSLRHGGPG